MYKPTLACWTLTALICGLMTALCLSSYYNEVILCEITAVRERNCWLSNGDTMMEIYVTINNNAEAALKCGIVQNCDTSPCNIHYELNKLYHCAKYTSDLYMVDTSNTPDIRLVLGFISLGIMILAIVAIAVTLTHQLLGN
jgi:hypothetical protein